MAKRDNVSARCEDIIKSENDDRLYRGLVLNNKMKVLLISDPTTDTSVAALDINLGGMCDPNDFPGLAHFCVYMLMPEMESPELIRYDSYLLKNGGARHVLTQFDHTTYYFNVNASKLKGALKRFAQIFLTPLFAESSGELELDTIYSEYLILASETWRLDHIERSSEDPLLYSDVIIKDRETLDVLPKQMGINLQQRLFEFYEKYYSANVMSLCVLGAETLDKLEKMVVKFFSRVQNKDIDIPISTEHPFDDEHFLTKWYMDPIEDTKNLRVVFPISGLQEYNQAAPIYYLSHLLTHKGEGTFMTALLLRGWCNSILCGKRLLSQGFCVLILQVGLTDMGFMHVDDIITLLFQYINMLKEHGPVEWIYNEYRDLAEIQFRFTEKQEPLSYVCSKVVKLRNYPMKEVLCGNILFPQWKPELVDNLMKYLTPRNIRVLLAAETNKEIANKIQHWYGTKYKQEKISTGLIDTWENAGFIWEFDLPPKNEFIPSSLDLKPRDDKAEEFPKIIEDTPFVRLWFKQDDEYLVPKAKMFFHFVSPYSQIDADSCNLTSMYGHVLQDMMDQYTYRTCPAGIHCSVEHTLKGILLTIFGYDDKQHLLLEKILDRMFNLKIDPQKFEIMKKDCMKELKNVVTGQPNDYKMYYISLLLTEQAWTDSELLNATAYLTVDRVRAFIPQLFSKVHVECLIHGNIIEKEALYIARMIEYKLKSAIPHITPLGQQQLMTHREIMLDDGRHFFFQTEDELYKDFCTGVYYQIGMQSTESNMLLKLLSCLIEDSCLSSQTREKLGSAVLCGVYQQYVMQGLIIIVQSNTHPRYVEKRIDLFLNSMVDYISTMSEDKFRNLRDSLVMFYLEKPKLLFDRTNVFWGVIVHQLYNFDQTNIEMAYLKTVTQEQIVSFLKENILGPARRKLSLHVIPTLMDIDESEEENNEFDNMLATGEIIEINDVPSFKCSQSLYPVLKPCMQFPKKGMHSLKL